MIFVNELNISNKNAHLQSRPMQKLARFVSGHDQGYTFLILGRGQHLLPVNHVHQNKWYSTMS